MAGKIKDVVAIHCEGTIAFEQKVKDASSKYNNYDVEVQFQASNGHLYALVIAREKE